MDHGGTRSKAAWALAAYCLVLAFILLNPSAELPSASVSLIADVGRVLGVPEFFLVGSRAEFVVNAAMFAPVSLLGSIVWKASTWRDWTAYVFLASGFAELVQGVVLSQRSATFVDVVANTLGALAGGVLMWVIRQRDALSGS